MSQNWVVALNTWGSILGPALFRASLQGGIFVFVVWLICRFIKVLPASAKSWLWWIASLQMLIRLVVISPLALPILPAQEVNKSSLLPITRTANNDPGVTSRRANFSSAELIQPSFPTTPKMDSKSPLGVAQAKIPETHISVMAIGCSFWLLGVLTCLTISLRRLAGTRRLLCAAVPIESGAVYELVQEFSFDYRIPAPRLLESPDALCPLLAGWARPAVVLPSQKASSLTEPQIRMAIAHEIAHLRRKDLWFGIVPAITQSLFYFHPLAWLAAHEGATAREAACDSDALRMSGSSPAAYARLLIDSAQSRSSMAVLGTAFGYRLIQRRISMLKTLTSANAHRYRSASTFAIALAAVCALPWSVTAQAPNLAKKSATKHSSSKPTHKPAKNTATHQRDANLLTIVSRAPQPARADIVAARAATRMVQPPYPGGLPVHAVPVPPTLPTPPAPAVTQGGFGGGSVGFSVGPAEVGAFPSTRASLPPVRASELPTQAAQVAVAVGMAPATTRTTPALAESAPSSRTNVTLGDNGRVQVELDKADIHEALKRFFKAYKTNFIIKSDVLSDTVTCSLNDVDLEFTLQKILSAVKQPLTYRVEGGVYTIMAKEKE